MRNRIIVCILAFGCLFFGLKTDSNAQMPAAPTIEGGEQNEKIDSSIATFYFDPSAQTGGGNKKTFKVAFNTATKSPYSTRYVSNNNFESHISFGKDRVVHRIITDRKAGLYFGYDVEITPVPSTIVSWTPTLVIVELDILHGSYYDVTVEIKGKSSRAVTFRP